MGNALSSVYFIQADESGPIKIGFTADDPKRRLNQLQTGNASALKLLGFVRGTPADEKQLHVELAEWRLQGEWFQSHPSVLARIQAALYAEQEQGQGPHSDDGGPCCLHCSFCLSCSHEVEQLVAGPAGNICDACVVICSKIMEHQKAEKENRKAAAASLVTGEQP